VKFPHPIDDVDRPSRVEGDGVEVDVVGEDAGRRAASGFDLPVDVQGQVIEKGGMPILSAEGLIIK